MYPSGFLTRTIGEYHFELLVRLRHSVAGVGLMALSEEQASLGIGGPVDVNTFAAFWEDIWETECKADP